MSTILQRPNKIHSVAFSVSTTPEVKQRIDDVRQLIGCTRSHVVNVALARLFEQEAKALTEKQVA